MGALEAMAAVHTYGARSHEREKDALMSFWLLDFLFTDIASWLAM
jgi:hypothetical protein